MVHGIQFPLSLCWNNLVRNTRFYSSNDMHLCPFFHESFVLWGPWCITLTWALSTSSALRLYFWLSKCILNSKRKGCHQFMSKRSVVAWFHNDLSQPLSLCLTHTTHTYYSFNQSDKAGAELYLTVLHVINYFNTCCSVADTYFSCD